MKKVLVLAALAALVTTSAFAAITNTKHDLSVTSTSGGLKTDATEICVFCHTPHGAATGANYLPLWNRSAATTPTGFYTSDSMDHVTSEVATQATDAYLCLSCHDGIQQMDALNNPPNTGLTTGNFTLSGLDSDLTLDMSNDHPIGFVYGGSATDPELLDTPALPFFGAAQDEMWCSTCHDVHGTAFAPFLQADNAGSGLCKTCHIK